MKTIITLVALLCLAGCSDRFRYPCQDPANWENAECKKPACEVTRTCPDLLVKANEPLNVPAPTEQKIDKKGDCK